MRSMHVIGVLFVLGIGFLAAQPFRHSGSQPTAEITSSPPSTPLRWNEPVPLQVSSSEESSPAAYDLQADSGDPQRPTYGQIPQIRASGDLIGLSDPPPSIAPSYGTAPAAQPSASPVTTARPEPAPAATWTASLPRDGAASQYAAVPPRHETHDVQTAAVHTHRVVDGDSLQQLAQRYLGSASRYLEIYEANRDVLSSPDLLPIGLTLKIPAAAQPTTPVGSATRVQPAVSPAASQTSASGLVPIGGWPGA